MYEILMSYGCTQINIANMVAICIPDGRKATNYKHMHKLD